MNSRVGFNFRDTVPRLSAGETVRGIVPLDETPDSSIYCLRQRANPCILRISTPTPERDDGRTSTEGFAYRLEALQRGQGLKGFEQLIEYSIEEEAVVTHKAPGKPLPELTTAEVGSIRPQHLEAVARAIGTGALHGITIDSDASNMIFHPQGDITIVDYFPEDEVCKPEKDYAYFLVGVGSIPAPVDGANHKRAWARVFNDGLVALRQTFDVEPNTVLSDLEIYQRVLNR